MIKEGVEVQIVDNRTKEDLTSVTLAQIIFEEEKKQNQMPLEVLREIIRRPGEALTGFIQKEVTPRVASIREEAETRLDKLLRREDGSLASRAAGEEAHGRAVRRVAARGAAQGEPAGARGLAAADRRAGEARGGEPDGQPAGAGPRHAGAHPAAEQTWRRSSTSWRRSRPAPGPGDGGARPGAPRAHTVDSATAPHHLRSAAPGRVLPDGLAVALGPVDLHVVAQRRGDASGK